MRYVFVAILALAPSAAGCGGGEESVPTVPVSGVVTLDDKPLAGALVRFEPAGNQAKEGWTDSSGVTDAEGRYTLDASKGGRGAVVGPHRVTIDLAPDPEAVDASTEGAPAPKARPKKLIPAKYNSQSTLTFEVPAGGTDAANFDLKSR